ncbi:LolA family protein [Rhizomicrobium electricum]|uniref:Outer membrane lipoprotein carrier protein LolA n=1 Tax=Rhizomicrobium electricum TaxID=480070 RepID=A0ABN1EXM5_9PROT|nr:outer-membrane lipoprotein carrier protein LolA [Rhizomicrobium electricum]NIJ49903.1 outer membrane lipoprotein-sorting protein [Rhizomicrobium electricum]
MRRFVQILVLAAAAVVATGAGQPPPARHIEFSDADRADLDKVTTYLNGIRSLEGGFVQIGPNGQIDQGKFYLVKPGKLRFEYQPPSPLLVVCDGNTFAVFNKKMKTVDRYPLSSIPLDVLLGENVDLKKDGSIVKLQRSPGTLVIEARTSKNRSKANIAITFSYPELELRQWTVIDDQGLPTTVALRNLKTGTNPDPSLFVLRDSKGVGAKTRD